MDDIEERRAAMLADIAAHLKEYGSERWNLVMGKYPEVGKRQFFKYVAKVKAGRTPQDILLSSVKKAKIAARRNLPAAPSPDVISKGGITARNHIDFMVEFGTLMEDAHLVRDFASTVVEGKRSIKNPMFFVKSVQLRVSLMETQLKAMDAIWNLTQQLEFYNAVVEEVAKESPEAARRIMERLERLNAEKGMTMYATPGPAVVDGEAEEVDGDEDGDGDVPASN